MIIENIILIMELNINVIWINKINNDIVKYIINKNNNYDNVGIKIKMKNSCSIDKGNNYSKSIRLLNIIYRCEKGTISDNKQNNV